MAWYITLVNATNAHGLPHLGLCCKDSWPTTPWSKYPWLTSTLVHQCYKHPWPTTTLVHVTSIHGLLLRNSMWLLWPDISPWSMLGMLMAFHCRGSCIWIPMACYHLGPYYKYSWSATTLVYATVPQPATTLVYATSSHGLPPPWSMLQVPVVCYHLGPCFNYPWLTTILVIAMSIHCLLPSWSILSASTFIYATSIQGLPPLWSMLQVFMACYYLGLCYKYQWPATTLVYATSIHGLQPSWSVLHVSIACYHFGLCYKYPWLAAIMLQVSMACYHLGLLYAISNNMGENILLNRSCEELWNTKTTNNNNNINKTKNGY